MEIRSEKAKENEKAMVVHVDDEGNATAINDAEVVSGRNNTVAEVTKEPVSDGITDGAEAQPSAYDIDSMAEEAEEIADAADETDTAAFIADEFSVYAIVYTVDFHWEVDGKVYEFSIPGGGFASFEHLVEALGISNTTGKGSSDNQNVPETGGNEPQNFVDKEVEESGINTEQTEAEGSAPLTLADVVVSDAARDFVADVTKVEFSSPSLVDVSRVEAGDWALISVLPFTSEETLTVTMKNGDQFEIRVTDRAYGSADRANVTVPNLNGLMTVNMFNYGPSSELDTTSNSYDSGNSVSNEGINSYSSLKQVNHAQKKKGQSSD